MSIYSHWGRHVLIPVENWSFRFERNETSDTRCYDVNTTKTTTEAATELKIIQ